MLQRNSTHLLTMTKSAGTLFRNHVKVVSEKRLTGFRTCTKKWQFHRDRFSHYQMTICTNCGHYNSCKSSKVCPACNPYYMARQQRKRKSRDDQKFPPLPKSIKDEKLLKELLNVFDANVPASTTPSHVTTLHPPSPPLKPSQQRSFSPVYPTATNYHLSQRALLRNVLPIYTTGYYGRYYSTQCSEGIQPQRCPPKRPAKFHCSGSPKKAQDFPCSRVGPPDKICPPPKLTPEIQRSIIQFKRVKCDMTMSTASTCQQQPSTPYPPPEIPETAQCQQQPSTPCSSPEIPETAQCQQQCPPPKASDSCGDGGSTFKNIPPNPCCPVYHKPRARLYKMLALAVCFPLIIVQMLYVHGAGGFSGHHKHGPCCEYEYMRLRAKRFPWGDGEASLFHNPNVNFLPGECTTCAPPHPPKPEPPKPESPKPEPPKPESKKQDKETKCTTTPAAKTKEKC